MRAVHNWEFFYGDGGRPILGCDVWVWVLGRHVEMAMSFTVERSQPSFSIDNPVLVVDGWDRITLEGGSAEALQELVAEIKLWSV